jgi:glycosyltransferase involved in cell wall biosynthesis
LLLDDETERERCRALAARRVTEKFSWDAVTDSYERYFDRLLGHVTL